jgi:hypothetical protein
VTSGLSGSFSDNNLSYIGTPGTVYNPASGLGFANLTALRSFFAQAGNESRSTRS